MKIVKISLIVIGSLILIGAAGYLYASAGLKSKPGYIDITAPNVGSESALLSVKVGPGGVRPLRWVFEKFAENSDHVSERAFLSAIKDLQGVQLRIYDSGDNRHIFDSAISETTADLKGRNWETLVTIRDDEEKITVMQYLDNDQIAGLSIMASTPDKAFFLNLIGPFDIETIAADAKQIAAAL